jgi:hypothetical protein
MAISFKPTPPRIDFLHTNTDPVLGIDQSTAYRSGLAAGGGIAYALTNNVIGKVEYRYYDFGRYPRPGLPVLTANGQLPYTVDSTYSVVTLGLDYKFGEPSVRSIDRDALEADSVSCSKRDPTVIMPALMRRLGLTLAVTALCGALAGA